MEQPKLKYKKYKRLAIHKTCFVKNRNRIGQLWAASTAPLALDNFGQQAFII